MGSFSSARAIYGLSAKGTPTSTNVSGTVTIGVGQTQASFDDADIAYSFKVTSTGSGDVATLDIASGVVTQTTGTPTIADGDGKDFEGVTLPTLVTPMLFAAIPVGTPSGDFHITTSAGSNGIDKYIDAGSPYPLLCCFPSGGTIAFSFTGSGDAFTFTIIGKSS